MCSPCSAISAAIGNIVRLQCELEHRKFAVTAKMRRNDDVQWHRALTIASARFPKFVRDVLSLPASGRRSGRLRTGRIRTRTPPWRNPAIAAPKVRGRAQELMAARLERKRQAPLPSARLGSWPELRTLVKFPKRKWSTETWPEPRGAINHRDWSSNLICKKTQSDVS